MMQFYETYKDNEIVSTLLSQISWSNNLTILSSNAKISRVRHVRLRGFFVALKSVIR